MLQEKASTTAPSASGASRVGYMRSIGAEHVPDRQPATTDEVVTGEIVEMPSIGLERPVEPDGVVEARAEQVVRSVVRRVVRVVHVVRRGRTLGRDRMGPDHAVGRQVGALGAEDLADLEGVVVLTAVERCNDRHVIREEPKDRQIEIAIPIEIGDTWPSVDDLASLDSNRVGA